MFADFSPTSTPAICGECGKGTELIFVRGIAHLQDKEAL